MYLIFDLDDTLLTSDKRITKFTKDVLNSLQQKGHIIVINSARTFEYLEEYVYEIKPNYSICDGGAEIYKYKDLIYQKHISQSLVNYAVNLFKEYNITTFSVFNKKLYTQNIDYISQNKNAKYFDFSNPFDKSVSKITFKSVNGNIANDIAKRLNLKLFNYLSGDWYRLSASSKELGNQALFKLLNDKNPKYICFGDDIGDIEMLQSATIGVAMKNSIPDVLNKINEVTKYNNNSDGVAKYLSDLERKGIL